jgi:sensor histidine kinase YesM
MKKRNYLRKLGLRILVINIVFIFMKLTEEPDPTEAYINNTTIYYYVTAFILFMTTWEVNDWLIRRGRKKSMKNELVKNSMILFFTVLIVVSVASVMYYLGTFEYSHICNIQSDNPWSVYKLDLLRAFGLSLIFSIFNQFYSISQDKRNLEVSVLELKQEMVASKYSSLKSQISPHFLFNSLNTLTSLMYEDRDLASDFVTRLASCYRYILDNREQDLVSLSKELQFLDSFIFMMTVRHKSAIEISTDIEKSKQELFIPTLSIQMLVENALKHNYYSKEHPINIYIYVKDNYLIIENSLRKRKDSEESTQLGLSNIKKRYSYYTTEPVIIEENSELFKVQIPLIDSIPLENTQLSLTT